MESITSSIAALLPFVVLLSMLGMAAASLARVGGGDSAGGGILDALVGWAQSLRADTAAAGESPALDEWRPYIAAGGVALVAGGLFGLLLLGDVI